MLPQYLLVKRVSKLLLSQILELPMPRLSNYLYIRQHHPNHLPLTAYWMKALLPRLLTIRPMFSHSLEDWKLQRLRQRCNR